MRAKRRRRTVSLTAAAATCTYSSTNPVRNYVSSQLTYSCTECVETATATCHRNYETYKPGKLCSDGRDLRVAHEVLSGFMI